MAPSTTTPRFRLLLHGQDGSIPYLTPELTRLFFCPSHDGEGPSAINDEDGDWRWRREHFILGVAVKDTCVTAVYRDQTSLKKKRKKDGENGSKQPAKRAKREQSSSSGDENGARVGESADVTVSTSNSIAATMNNNGTKCTKIEQDEKNGMNNAKKPAGYTFLTQPQASEICTKIHSHLGDKDNHADASTGRNNNSYMQTHLRIPSYISTMIVPTYSLDYPDNTNTAKTDETKGDIEPSNANEEKKYAPKKQPPNQNPKKQKQQQQQKKDVIPNSTKDTMPVDTPHGWQKLRPEQYWECVLSLTQPSASTNSSTTPAQSISPDPLCEGAVGLFDHMGMDRDRINHLFAEFMKHDKDNGSANDEDAVIPLLIPQAQEGLALLKPTAPKGKWGTLLQRLVQRTNEWSQRTIRCREQLMQGEQQTQQSSIKFWTPVHMIASHLPLESLIGNPGSKPITEGQLPQPSLSNCSNVAIVGWDTIGYSQKGRRQALHKLMTKIQSSPTSPKQSLILSVSDLQSILDAAREGVSIIGTDFVRQWSCTGKALCLDLALDGNTLKDLGADETMDGMLDLSDEIYARDSSPLLSGCKCLACSQPQKKSTSNGSDQITKAASFTRAYIHHLIKAREMLAQTLLFIHNLHQVLMLFRQLNKAYSLDEGRGEKLEAFCQKIEEQTRR